MTRWLQWWILWRLTGSPVGALLVLVVLWWGADRFTFRLLPDPVGVFRRWRRREALRSTIAVNPHDRRARLELAGLLLDARSAREAADVLRPNVDAGDEDVQTAYTYGAALARGGDPERAERVLLVAREIDAGYRLGEIDLELGRLRLLRGDHGGARDALLRFVDARPGTVAGRYHLARALAALGDRDGARRAREDAWREYAHLPRFRRREERPYAWRIKPWRPAAVAAALAVAGLLASRAALPHLDAGDAAPRALPGESYDDAP